VDIADITLPTFTVLLKYMYDHSVDYDQIGENMEEVLLSANKYGVVGLVDTLVNIIAANLTESNAESMLEVAETQGFARLKISCLSFISSMKKKPKRAAQSAIPV